MRANKTVGASVLAAACLIVAIVVLPRPALSENEQLLAVGNSGQIVFDDEPDTAANAVTTTTEPPIPVLVVGSDSAAPDMLRSRGLTVIDGTNRYCPIVQALATQLPTGDVASIAGCTDATASWVAMARASKVVDVVITFGPIDEGVTRTRDDVGFPAANDFAELGGRWNRVFDRLGLVWDAFPSDFHLHLLHQGNDWGYLVDALTRFAAGRSQLSALHSSVESLSSELLAARADDTDTPRVLVVGDSTSVNFAVALFRASAGQLEVRWVGANGCPFVDVEWVRSSVDDPWDFVWCRSKIDQVGEQLATFIPDVVVLMVAPEELRYQRYKGDHRGHIAGDPTYTQVHDEYMKAFIAPLSEVGATLLVVDCPQMRTTEANRANKANDEMLSAERIALWNAQIQRWVDSSPDIQLLPYAAAINGYESTIGEVLFDGIHPDVDILEDLIRTQLLDVILAAAKRN